MKKMFNPHQSGHIHNLNKIVGHNHRRYTSCHSFGIHQIVRYHLDHNNISLFPFQDTCRKDDCRNIQPYSPREKIFEKTYNISLLRSASSPALCSAYSCNVISSAPTGKKKLHSPAHSFLSGSNCFSFALYRLHFDFLEH